MKKLLRHFIPQTGSDVSDSLDQISMNEMISWFLKPQCFLDDKNRDAVVFEQLIFVPVRSVSLHSKVTEVESQTALRRAETCMLSESGFCRFLLFCVNIMFKRYLLYY